MCNLTYPIIKCALHVIIYFKQLYSVCNRQSRLTAYISRTWYSPMKHTVSHGLDGVKVFPSRFRWRRKLGRLWTALAFYRGFSSNIQGTHQHQTGGIFNDRNMSGHEWHSPIWQSREINGNEVVLGRILTLENKHFKPVARSLDANSATYPYAQRFSTVY